MKKIVSIMALALLISANTIAEDHVMAATKKAPKRDVPAELSLSVEEAQDYAVKANRTLRNADLAVQQAYAQRWQTIAAMLPQADASWSYSSTCGYEMEFGGSADISAPLFL